MIEVMLDINRWGKNLVVPLPTAIACEAHLYAGQRIKLSVIDGQIIITPVEPLTLEQRLTQFDPERHGGEVMLR